MLEQGAISSQALYISYFLKKNRIEYYDRLNEVRNKGNFEQWIKFFLKAVIVSAKDAVDKIKLLSELHDLNIAKIEELGRARIPTRTVFEYLEKSPIIEISKTSRELGLSYNTVWELSKGWRNWGGLSLSPLENFGIEFFLMLSISIFT